MKQQNFLFVDLVSSIFLLVLLIGNFLGLLYIFEGNYIISSLGSIFLIVCYYFVIQLLKRNKEIMLKNNLLHSSSIFWLFLLLLGFVSFNLMQHFINVEFNCKNQIKKEASAKLRFLDSIASEYKKRSKDDLLQFEAELKTNLTLFKNTQNPTIKDTLLKEPFSIEPQILINPEFINVDQVAAAKVTPYQLKVDKNVLNIDKTLNTNGKKYQSIFDNWKRLSLAATYTKLNQYLEQNTNLINDKVAELPMDKVPFEITISKKQLPLHDMLKLRTLYPQNFIIPLSVIIAIHLFILIPFFAYQVRGYKSNKQKNKNSNYNGTSINKQKGTIEL